MQEGDQRHYAGGNSADLAETERHIDHEEKRRKADRHQALDKEHLSHRRADGFGGQLRQGVVGVLFNQCRIQRLLLIQSERVNQRNFEGIAFAVAAG